MKLRLDAAVCTDRGFAVRLDACNVVARLQARPQPPNVFIVRPCNLYAISIDGIAGGTPL